MGRAKINTKVNATRSCLALILAIVTLGAHAAVCSDADPGESGGAIAAALRANQILLRSSTGPLSQYRVHTWAQARREIVNERTGRSTLPTLLKTLVESLINIHTCIVLIGLLADNPRRFYLRCSGSECSGFRFRRREIRSAGSSCQGTYT